MKKITYLFLPLTLLAMFATACSDNVLFEDERTFDNTTWNRFTPEKFELTAKNTDEFYDFFVTVVIDTTRYRLKSLPLNINLYSPQGERRMFPSTVTLQAHTGQWKGTFDGSKITCRQRIRDCFCFNCEGDHKVEIGQATHYYDIVGIQSITFSVEKTELEYPD